MKVGPSCAATRTTHKRAGASLYLDAQAQRKHQVALAHHPKKAPPLPARPAPSLAQAAPRVLAAAQHLQLHQSIYKVDSPLVVADGAVRGC